MPDHQQKVTFVTNMGKLKNLSLLQTTIITWVMSTAGTEWLIPIHLVRDQGGGQKNDFSTSWT